MQAARLALLGLLLVAAQAVRLDFGSGWQHSDDAKYTGKFDTTADGLKVWRKE